MLYREIGKTGRQASVIGLGCEHIDRLPYDRVKETIDAALEIGVNHLDVFMPGREIRENIAKALGSKRGDVSIQGHFGSTDVREQYDISRDMPTVKTYFEDLLRIFGGYIDFGMLFFIDTEESFKSVFETDFAEYAATLKARGEIGHIGFGSHNPAIATRVIETGLPEMMMFSVNLAFDLTPADSYALDILEKGFDATAFRGFDPERSALYTLCEQKGIGITVMKTFGAGKLISPEHSPFQKPMTTAQCIHYALTRPAVASVMLGMKSRDEVLDAARYFDTPDDERDYTPLLGTLRNDFRGKCVYCGHCQPCPSDIDVASVNKYLDIARLDETQVPPSIRTHYDQLTAHGGDCVACGSCEERCPFGVAVAQNMEEAKRIFGR